MSWFDRYNILICVGSGGVGKTTISASLALLAAQAGKRTLVLTIDPAKRLASALGLEGQLEAEVEVPAASSQGRLFAYMIEPSLIFNEFVSRAAPDKASAERLLNNRLYKELATTLSGSQEFTSLEKLLEAHESGRFDMIILDTPPAQHAVDFLKAPERIFSLFQDSVTKWFLESQQGPGLVTKIFKRGTHIAFSALERVTGSQFIAELGDFFQSMSSLQKTVRERSVKVHRLMSAAKTGFVLVSSQDEAKLQEAEDFYQDLSRSGHHLVSVIVNRAGINRSQLEFTGTETDPSFEALEQFRLKILSHQQRGEALLADLAEKMGSPVEMLRVCEMHESINGIEGLERLAKTLRPRILDSNLK